VTLNVAVAVVVIGERVGLPLKLVVVNVGVPERVNADVRVVALGLAPNALAEKVVPVRRPTLGE
jgi:hypothetical protein